MWNYCVIAESDRHFSDEFLYDSDSKRVPEKVFLHESEASGEKILKLTGKTIIRQSNNDS